MQSNKSGKLFWSSSMNNIVPLKLNIIMYTCLFVHQMTLSIYIALIYLLGTRQAQMIWHLCMSRFIPLKQFVSYTCISIYS